MTRSTYTKATTVEEAVAALAAGSRPVAGGTDLVVGARQGKKGLPEALVGIHRIPGLDTVAEREGGLEIGALATHAMIVANPRIRSAFTSLADASAIVGSHATRANGTIGGNVMNASPAMDTGGSLLCLGGSVKLQGPNGSRVVPLDDFWTGPGVTVASPDELLVSISLPAPAPGTGSAYVRLQYRRQMEIAVVGVTAALSIADGVVTAAKIAITALAPTIHRVPTAEAAMIGSAGEQAAIDAAAHAIAEATRPISDVRASEGYRRAMAAVIGRRAIEAALTRSRGGQVAIPASESTYGS